LEEALRAYPAAQQSRLRELALADADAQLERALDLLKGVRLMTRRQQERESRAAKPLN
jgi:hypothetical protein